MTALALFLPPVSIHQRIQALSYTPLDAQSPAVLDPRLTISLAADQPASDFAIKLDSSQSDWLADAMAQLPAHLRPLDDIRALETQGQPPAALDINLALPLDMPPHAALYGWDGERWRFIPAQAQAGRWRGRADFAPLALGSFAQESRPPLLLMTQELQQDFDAALGSLADIYSPAGLRPTADGRLIGGLAAGGRADADYLFMPVIRNFSAADAIDSATLAALLGDARHARFAYPPC